MKYRMIVSDVDGTLFESGNKLNDSTIELVEMYQKSGGIFTLATGRMKKAIDPFIEQLKIRAPVIVYNGAQLANPHNQQLIQGFTVERELAQLVVKKLDGFRIDPIIHVNQQPFVLKITDAIKEHTIKDGIQCQVTNEVESLLLNAPTKFLLIGDPEELLRYLKVLEESWQQSFHYVFSDWNYLEILPQNASKGNALKLLSQHMEIPTEQIAVVGDERNDITMVKEAGFGAAVANANEALKSQADYITAGAYHYGLEEVIKKVMQG